MNTPAVDFTTLALGRTKTTMTPCGRVFLIREQNGNDDDILANPETQLGLVNIDNFLHAIVVKEIVNKKDVMVTMDTITTLPTKSRYHLLIASRVHSLGSLFKFKFDWGPDKERGGEFPYEEDLSIYLHDYSKPFPTEQDKGFFKYKIPPYEKGVNSETRYTTTLSTGRKVRFGVMTRVGEKLIMAMDRSLMTRNAELKGRFLEVEIDGTFVMVDHFGMFSKREMVEIHAAVEEADPTYNFTSELTHPRTNQIIDFPIMNSPDFFFPQEV